MENLRLYDWKSGHMSERTNYQYPSISYSSKDFNVFFMEMNKITMDFEISQEDVDNCNGEDVTIMYNGHMYDSLKIDGVEQAQPIEEKTILVNGQYALYEGAEPTALASNNVFPKVVQIHENNWIKNCDFIDNIKLVINEPVTENHVLLVYKGCYEAPYVRYYNEWLEESYNILDLMDNNEGVAPSAIEDIVTIELFNGSQLVSKVNEILSNACAVGLVVVDMSKAEWNNEGDAYFFDDSAMVSCNIYTSPRIGTTIGEEVEILYTRDDLIYTYEEFTVTNPDTNESVTRMGYRVTLPVDKYYSPHVSSIQVHYDNTTTINDSNLFLGKGYVNVRENHDESIGWCGAFSDQDDDNCVDYDNNIFNVTPNWWSCSGVDDYYNEDGYLCYYMVLSGKTNNNVEQPISLDDNNEELYYLADNGIGYITDINAILPFTATTRCGADIAIQSNLNTWVYDPAQVYYKINEESWVAEPWKGQLLLTFDEALTADHSIIISYGVNNELDYYDFYPLSADWFEESFEAVDDTHTKFKFLWPSAWLNMGDGACLSFTAIKNGTNNMINSTIEGYFGGVHSNITLPTTEAKIYQVVGIVYYEIPTMVSMFEDCDRLINVDLSCVNTSKITSMLSMFRGCTKLQNVNFGKDFDTSRVTLLNYMFFNCYSLTSVDCSMFDINRLSSYYNMFGNCSNLTSFKYFKKTPALPLTMTDMKLVNLTSIDFSAWKSRNVVSLRKLCANCPSLTDVVFPFNLNTKNVTDMGQMFSGCTNLTSLDLSSFDTSNVTTMHGMFSNCSGLTSLDLSNFNTSKVSDMGNMFERCNNLTSLDLNNFNTSKVIYMDQMFDNCSGLTTVNLRTFDTSIVYSIRKMFNGCVSLTSLDLSSFDISKVTNMSETFNGCDNLTHFKYFKKVNETQRASLNTNLNLTAVTSVDFSAWDNSEIHDAYDLCSGCTSLTSVTFGNECRLNNAAYMFANCENLTSLDLHNVDVSQVINGEHMFTNCNNLTTLKYFKKTPDIAFSLCGLDLTTATSIDFSEWDTSNVTSMSGLCSGCTALTSVTFGEGFDTSNVTDMNNMFNDCNSLTSIDVSNFDTSKVTDMSKMFSNCNSLSSLDIKNFNTSNVTNMQGMFENASKLTIIYFGDNANVSNVQMYDDMFKSVAASGKLYYSYDSKDIWENMLLVNQTKSQFPSTWTAEPLYTPYVCKSLNIVVDNVPASATSATIQYTTVTDGYYGPTQKEVYDIKKIGYAQSNEFPANTTLTAITHDIQFEYLGVVASTKIKQDSVRGYTLQLNGQWEYDSSTYNPSTSLYDGVYRSFGNYHVHSSKAKMYITIHGYDTFKIYVRSYGEKNSDYVEVSHLDAYIPDSPSWNGVNVKKSTYGNSKSGTDIGSYTLVEFTNIGGGTHTITIVYKKDSYQSLYADRGYLLIPKNQ